MIPEKRLFQAVLYQAFADATMEYPTSDEGQRAKRDADAWIRGCRRDFRKVCALADMDPDFLHEAYVNGKVNRELLKSASV